MFAVYNRHQILFSYPTFIVGLIFSLFRANLTQMVFLDRHKS